MKMNCRKKEGRTPRTVREARPAQPGKRPGSAANQRSGFSGAVLADDALHLILELEFPLLEGDFFELFWFREVVPGGQSVQFLVEIVVLCRELAVLLVGLQQLTLQLIEVCRHRRLLEGISWLQ